MVQNPEQRDFTGNTKNIPLMSASSRININVDQDRNDETRSFENFEDDDFPALRPKYDRNAHAYHNFVRLKTHLGFLQVITGIFEASNGNPVLNNNAML